jgi:hypothetical protein
MGYLIIDKTRMLEVLNEFPDDIVLEDFIDRIMIIAKIEKARDKIKKAII